MAINNNDQLISTLRNLSQCCDSLISDIESGIVGHLRGSITIKTKNGVCVDLDVREGVSYKLNGKYWFKLESDLEIATLND